MFVITNEMIRRSGATSIPELLRMAPGVNVARIDGSKWAISIRGFNGRFANKLLVQIDGRTVYTPLFAGVFWDVQDVILEDIERIEVIRGPGATIWGANAVNGVINILTKKSKDTQGVSITAGGGTEQRGFSSARLGGKLTDDLHYRVFGKWFERDNSFAFDGNNHDDWRMGRGGFRMDWTPDDDDTLTLQGDYYDGYTGRRNIFPSAMPPTFTNAIDDDAHVAGGNALMRFTRTLDDESDWSFQFYYDRTERNFVQTGFGENRNTFDVDFTYRFPLGDRHSLICGAGYRLSEDKISNLPGIIDFLPDNRRLNLWSYFVQDEITLKEDLYYLTLGSKFQHNDFTGFEIQPTARLLWTPSERTSLWTSVSRAVRTPSRAEDDVVTRFAPTVVPTGFPPPNNLTAVFPIVNGQRGFLSEELTAYEAGIRVQQTDQFSWDFAMFLHSYDNLTTANPGMPTVGSAMSPFPFFPHAPLTVSNQLHGMTYGFELSANYEVSEDWRLTGAYTFLRTSLTAEPGAVPGADDEGNSPRNQLYMQSSWDIGDRTEFDLIARYVDELPSFNVPSYFTMDLRLGWRPDPDVEFSVVARHLLDASHPEFGSDGFTGNLATQVQREVFASVTWRR